MSVRCLYLDLDSTLLGRGASMLHDGEGNVTIDGVRAVQACLRAGVEVVLMSGRRRAQVMEDARLLGQSSFIFEAGACVVLDGEEHWLTGELLPGELTIAEQIERSGAPELLLERYSGRLEYHEPWHLQREVSHLFRGLVDAVEVDQRAGRARPREPAAGRQRGREPALAGARGAAARARLPPGARRRVQGRGGGAASAGARLCARGDVRGGRLARGSRVRRRGRDDVAGRQCARARSLDARGDRRVPERARVRGRARARACTRPSSAP